MAHVCQLCSRKFADACALSLHEQYSQLHKQNLDRQGDVLRQHQEELLATVHRLRQQLQEASSSSNPEARSGRNGGFRMVSVCFGTYVASCSQSWLVRDF